MNLFISWNMRYLVPIAIQETGLPSDFFTHVLTNFGIMLFPNPMAAMNGL
jgi:hypothetical protein